METIIYNLSRYLISQIDKVTAWIGVIGLILQFLGLHSFMFMLFIALIILPEAHFTETFKQWAKKIREIESP